MGGAQLKRFPPRGRVKPLTLVWLATTLPLLLYALLFGQSVGAIIGAALQLAVACTVALLPLPRTFRWIILATLLVFTAAGVLERELSRNDWQVSDKAGIWSALKGQNTVQNVGYRSWHAPDIERASLRLDVRLLQGKPGWDWYRSNARFRLTPLSAGGVPFTRVTVPERTENEGQPYLMRTFDTHESLKTRIFKVILEIRRAPPPGTPDRGESVSPPLQRGEPIGGRDCFGVLLQAWNERGGGRCLPITLTDDWQRYSLSWRVPDEIDPQAHVVRILIQGFGGETLDLRRIFFYRGLTPLGPLQPQGAALQVNWGAPPESQSGFSFIPTAAWQTLERPLVRGSRSTETLSVALSTGDGLRLETRNVAVRGPDGTRFSEAVSSARQTIVFSDPNLAGHSLGTLGLAFVSLASPLWGALGAGITLFDMFLTGSRAALLGVVAGLLGLAWLWLPRKWRPGLALAALFGAAVLLGLARALPQLSALRLLSFSQITARSDIWSAAWDAFTAHPLRGLGEGGFSLYWAANYGGEAVQHAHNFWLESAVSYGVLGLLSALALSAGLLVYAARQGGVPALILVGSVLLMNLFDTTLYYSGVLFTLMLGLATLSAPSPFPRSVSSRRAHNGAVTAFSSPQAPGK